LSIRGRYFVLIAGTSTGGIIAIGLGLGLSAKDMLRLYEDQGPAIFDQQHGAFRNWITRSWRDTRNSGLAERNRRMGTHIFGDGHSGCISPQDGRQ
jgi:hypothetical protein